MAIALYAIFRRALHLFGVVAILELVTVIIGFGSLYGYVTSPFWVFSSMVTINRITVSLFLVIMTFAVWLGARILR